MGRISNDDSNYLSQVYDFVDWCEQQYLKLNVKKTKEMIFDFRTRNRVIPEKIKVDNETVDRVTEYKYLGVVIDEELKGTANNSLVYKKCKQGLHFLNVLKSLRVERNILTLFYRSVVESVICFSITVWFGRLPKKEKNKVNKIIKSAKRSGAQCETINDLYNRLVIKQTDKIMSDVNHPLHGNYVFLRSGKRLTVPIATRDRYRDSFVPKSIKIFNHTASR